MLTPEMENVLTGAGATVTETGTWRLRTPHGTPLELTFPEDSEDLYAEAEIAERAGHEGVALCRDLCAMNIMWRDLAGFTAAMSETHIVVQTREPVDRLADRELFAEWLKCADVAIRNTEATIYLAERRAGGTDENASAKGDL